MELGMQAQGLDHAALGMEQRAAKLRNMEPFYKIVAADFERTTKRAFAAGESPQGEKHKELKQSTIKARIYRDKRANKRDEFGDLTLASESRRAAHFAPGGAQPLIDSSDLRDSMHWEGTAGGAAFSMLRYGVPHVTGSKDGTLPKRNPTMFEKVGTEWVLAPQHEERFRKLLRAYVENQGVT